MITSEAKWSCKINAFQTEGRNGPECWSITRVQENLNEGRKSAHPWFEQGFFHLRRGKKGVTLIIGNFWLIIFFFRKPRQQWTFITFGYCFLVVFHLLQLCLLFVVSTCFGKVWKNMCLSFCTKLDPYVNFCLFQPFMTMHACALLCLLSLTLTRLWVSDIFNLPNILYFFHHHHNTYFFEGCYLWTILSFHHFIISSFTVFIWFTLHLPWKELWWRLHITLSRFKGAFSRTNSTTKDILTNCSVCRCLHIETSSRQLARMWLHL